MLSDWTKSNSLSECKSQKSYQDMKWLEKNTSATNTAKMNCKFGWKSIFSVISFLQLIIWEHQVSGFVIAPPWANEITNPCSKKSWQLLYWPKTQKCYKIFEQGPCPKSQELGYNPITKLAECRCPKDLLFWPAANR